jgi:hypothetical protein
MTGDGDATCAVAFGNRKEYYGTHEDEAYPRHGGSQKNASCLLHGRFEGTVDRRPAPATSPENIEGERYVQEILRRMMIDAGGQSK